MNWKLRSKDYNQQHEQYDSRKKTSIQLMPINNNVLLGKSVTVSGFLKDMDGNRMVNKGVVVFFDNQFVKTIITNKNGFFKEYFLAKSPGKREIKLVYDGDWEFEKTSTSKFVNFIDANKKEKRNEGIGDQLEKLAKLYTNGLLSEDEFEMAKKKLIEKY